MQGPARALVVAVLCGSVCATAAAAPPADAAGRQREVLVLYGTARDSRIAIIGEREFPRLLAAGLVDEVSFNVVPVLLGGGIPLLPPPADRARLKLKQHRIYEKTGTVSLEYEVVGK